MLFSIACLIASRLIRNHFAVPVREVAMLTSSSCFGARVGCVVRGVVCGVVGACLAGRSWRCGAVLPAARIVWLRPGGVARVLREAPLRALGGRVRGWGRVLCGGVVFGAGPVCGVPLCFWWGAPCCGWPPVSGGGPVS